MAGRHSKRGARTPLPVQRRGGRRRGIEVVDAQTKLAHQVSDDELLAGRKRGNYQGLCGTHFDAASMVEPGRGPCQLCQHRATS